MILVPDTGSMKTQGQSELGISTFGIRTPRRPRRSVVSGSLGALVIGAVLSSTALPAFARSLAATPTTQLTASSTSVLATSTTSSTTTTVATPPTTVPRRTDTTTPAADNKSARVVRASVSVVSHPANTPSLTPPAKKKPTTVATTVPTTVPPAPKPVVKAAPAVALKLSANIPPNPNFLSSGTGSVINGVVTYQNPCITSSATWPHFTDAPACNDYVLQAINNARSIEGVTAMVLPSNWYSLTTAQQLFVVADLERVDRGLPAYVGLNSALTAAAQHAAATKSDPGIAAGFPIGTDAQNSPAMGGAWAGGYSVLVADYIWMYDDGWGGSANTSNVVCTSPGAAGCWAHRDELLGYDPGYNPGVGLMCTTCEMGTGFSMVNGTSASYVDLIEMPKSGEPSMTFTWADEQQFLG